MFKQWKNIKDDNKEQLWLLTGSIAQSCRPQVPSNTETNKSQYRQACYDAKNDEKYDVMRSEIDKMIIGSPKFYE